MIYSKARLKHRLLVLLMDEIKNPFPGKLKKEEYLVVATREPD